MTEDVKCNLMVAVLSCTGRCEICSNFMLDHAKYLYAMCSTAEIERETNSRLIVGRCAPRENKSARIDEVSGMSSCQVGADYRIKDIELYKICQRL